MKFQDFQKCTFDNWDDYFSKIQHKIATIQIFLGGYKNIKFLYPNIILFTETQEHYIAEFFGAGTKYEGLSKKINKKDKKDKKDSTIKYLYQFEDQEDKEIGLVLESQALSDLFFTTEYDSDFLDKRFPFHKRYGTRTIHTNCKEFVLGFSPNFKYSIFNDCLIGNKKGNIYRTKHINLMIIFNKEASEEDYFSVFKTETERSLQEGNAFVNIGFLYGVQSCRTNLEKKYILAGQFANLFLFPGLRETTIGEFINKNRDIVLKALSCKSLLYEPTFKWIEGSSDPNEKNINPDLIVESRDGRFDIYDLKTALLERNNITKGGQRRRRFIDYVNAGIAQLANYEKYFTFEGNKQLVRNKYNIEVSNPDLILVVGNYENVRPEEIEQAKRMLRSNYYIIDYDTFNAMFLKSNS